MNLIITALSFLLSTVLQADQMAQANLRSAVGVNIAVKFNYYYNENIYVGPTGYVASPIEISIHDDRLNPSITGYARVTNYVKNSYGTYLASVCTAQLSPSGNNLIKGQLLCTDKKQMQIARNKYNDRTEVYFQTLEVSVASSPQVDPVNGSQKFQMSLAQAAGLKE